VGADLLLELRAQLGSVYVVERELAGGAMARVFVADETRLRRKVVIKVLPPDLAAAVSAVRFEREILLGAALQHPHIVPVLTAGEVSGIPYFTMPFVEGESLAQRLRSGGALPIADAVRLLRQVASALEYAHARGVVHRDIKPGNIFLTDSDGDVFVKLLDFGVAKQVDQDFAVTRTNEKVGTPLYMCPEQLISAKHVDFRADLWSIGIVAYHCLMGHVPYRASTFGDLCLVVSRGLFTLPSDTFPELSPQVDGWFVRALARKPEGRFESAKQAAEELARVMKT